MQKIAITGAKGQLGTELLRQIKQGECTLGKLPASYRQAQIVAVDMDVLDITNKAAVDAFLEAEKPDVVINCSAYTNVDACEENQQIAFAVNTVGARNMAIACEAVGAKLLHVSTDYVFAGCGTNIPYSEYDLPAPQSIYGKTKWAGEEYVKQFCSKYFVVRTSWLYGYAGNNFVKTILKAARKSREVKVVDDQVGNPTNAEDLAFHLLLLAVSEEYGIYHCTGEGICSWYDFAKEIIKLGKVDAAVTPCTTDEFPRPAKRPAYSALENRMLEQTVGSKMRAWQEALQVFFANYKEDSF